MSSVIAAEGVPEHLLDCLDVGPGADGETSCRVAEVVRSNAWHGRLSNGFGEPS